MGKSQLATVCTLPPSVSAPPPPPQCLFFVFQESLMLLKEKLVYSKSRLRLAPMYPPLPFWSVSPLVSVLMRFN